MTVGDRKLDGRGPVPGAAATARVTAAPTSSADGHAKVSASGEGGGGKGGGCGGGGDGGGAGGGGRGGGGKGGLAPLAAAHPADPEIFHTVPPSATKTLNERSTATADGDPKAHETVEMIVYGGQVA